MNRKAIVVAASILALLLASIAVVMVVMKRGSNEKQVKEFVTQRSIGRAGEDGDSFRSDVDYSQQHHIKFHSDHTVKDTRIGKSLEGDNVDPLQTSLVLIDLDDQIDAVDPTSKVIVKPASGKSESLVSRLEKMKTWYKGHLAQHLPESYLKNMQDLKSSDELKVVVRFKTLLKIATGRQDWNTVRALFQHCKVKPNMWHRYPQALFQVLLNANWNRAGGLMADAGLKPDLVGGLAQELIVSPSHFDALVRQLAENPDYDLDEPSAERIAPFGKVAKAVATKGKSLKSSQDLFDLLAVLARPQLKHLWTEELIAGIDRALVDPEYLAVKKLSGIPTPEEMHQYLGYVVQLCSDHPIGAVSYQQVESLFDSLPSDYHETLGDLIRTVVEIR